MNQIFSRLSLDLGGCRLNSLCCCRVSDVGQCDSQRDGLQPRRTEAPGVRLFCPSHNPLIPLPPAPPLPPPRTPACSSLHHRQNKTLKSISHAVMNDHLLAHRSPSLLCCLSLAPPAEAKGRRTGRSRYSRGTRTAATA